MRLRPRSLHEADDAPIVDALFEPDLFRMHRAQILPLLRAKHDPPPREVRFGNGDPRKPALNLALALAASPGARIVRGFRMILARPVACLLWKAYLDAVLARPIGTNVRTKLQVWPGGRVRLRLFTCKLERYESVTSFTSDADQGGGLNKTYVFVPSSRAHAELTDAQLLSGDYLFGQVLGGDPYYVEALVRHLRISGRKSSLVGPTPESFRALPRVTISLFPHFAEFVQREHPARDLETLAEQLGFPIRSIHDPLHSGQLVDDLINHDVEEVVARHTQKDNPFAVLDGTITFAFTQQTYYDRLEGRISEQTEVERFFDHYRNQVLKLDALLRQRAERENAKMGLRASDSPMA
jgi:hypothetical protein